MRAVDVTRAPGHPHLLTRGASSATARRPDDRHRLARLRDETHVADHRVVEVGRRVPRIGREVARTGQRRSAVGRRLAVGCHPVDDALPHPRRRLRRGSSPGPGRGRRGRRSSRPPPRATGRRRTRPPRPVRRGRPGRAGRQPPPGRRPRPLPELVGQSGSPATTSRYSSSVNAFSVSVPTAPAPATVSVACAAASSSGYSAT